MINKQEGIGYMKLLLVCAGGMSTSILMKKLEKYAADKGIEFEVVARGVGDYEDICSKYDVILLGPQVSYRKDDIAATSGKPIAVIAPYDYAIGNAENIFKQINQLLGI